MKKMISIVLYLVFIFTLSGCSAKVITFDYTDLQNIPEKTTMNFELPQPEHDYGTWTSNNPDVIEIVDNSQAVVHRQETDVEVTLRISVRFQLSTKKHYKYFKVTVLSIHAEPTVQEKLMGLDDFLADYLHLTGPVELPETFEGLNLSFEMSERTCHYGVIKQDGSKWLMPKIVNTRCIDKVGLVIYHEDKSVYAAYEILVNDYIFDVNNPMHNLDNLIVMNFFEGDSKDRVSKLFYLPQTLAEYEGSTIEWTSLNTSVIRISTDNLQANVWPSDTAVAVDLLAHIIIDELPYDVIYTVTVKR